MSKLLKMKSEFFIFLKRERSDLEKEHRVLIFFEKKDNEDNDLESFEKLERII